MMKTERLALRGARIFDSQKWHDDSALLICDGRIEGIVDRDAIPSDYTIDHLDGGFLCPGLIDLQVNGGGGIQWNQQTDRQAIEAICRTHARYGTTALLITLITDTRDKTQEAVTAAIEAEETQCPGFLGLHLEGPHLAHRQKGAHDPTLLRPMCDEDLATLIEAKKRIGSLLITLALESVTQGQIQTLHEAGCCVFLGHSHASYNQTMSAADHGLRGVTHLYNAMSGLHHRDAGIVGAVFEHDNLHASLIGDLHHVSPEVIAISLRAKKKSGLVFLVSDAMATVGSTQSTITLNGRTITRSSGKLVLSDGTLAGSDHPLIKAVGNLVDVVGLELEEALRMASLYPATCLGLEDTRGHLYPNALADIIHIEENWHVNASWIKGQRLPRECA